MEHISLALMEDYVNGYFADSANYFLKYINHKRARKQETVLLLRLELVNLLHFQKNKVKLIPIVVSPFKTLKHQTLNKLPRLQCSVFSRDKVHIFISDFTGDTVTSSH